ncbi:hypothetical protein ACHAWT_001678 [Skeletonema menzelii]
MNPLTISAQDSVDTERIKNVAIVVETRKWPLPKIKDESRHVEEQSSSSVDDGVRQDHELAAVSELSTSEEPMLSSAAATSPRVDESVELMINQFSQEHEELLEDVSPLVVVEQTSDETVVMDHISSLIFNVNKQAAHDIGSKESIEKDQNQARDINKHPSPEKPPADESITNSRSQESKPVSTVPSSDQPSQMPGEEVVYETATDESIEKVFVDPEKDKAGKKWMTKFQKKKSFLKKLPKTFTGKMISKKNGPQPTIQEKQVIVEDSATTWSAGSMSLKSPVSEGEVASVEPSDSKTTIENPEVDAVRNASSSLMDKDEEDETDVEAGHLDEEVPKPNDSNSINSGLPAKKKSLNLTKLLSLGACSVKTDTPAEFNIDHVESDGYDGGSEKTSEDEAAPKGLFSCGAVPTSPRKGGIFDGLTSVQSDAAVGITTDIDDEEVKALTNQAYLLSIGEENATYVHANESKESQPQQLSVSSIPSISEGSESKKPGEKKEVMKNSNSEEDNLPLHAEPSEKKEIKLTKTNSLRSLPAEPSEKNEDKSCQRAEPSNKNEIKLTKTISTQDKSCQRAEPSEKKENAKKSVFSSLRVSSISKKKETKMEEMTKKETESAFKSDHQAALDPQESPDKSLGKQIEHDNILEITKTNSSGLLAAPSSLSADTFVCQMEAKVDLYNEKYGLIQKFGMHVKELKKKQAEIREKELEVEEAKKAVQRAGKIRTMKRKRKELASIQRELEKLRKEEEVVKVPVARLHHLLNAQLDSEIIGNESIEEALPPEVSKLCMCGVMTCQGNNTDEEDDGTVDSGILLNQLDAVMRDDEGREQNSRMSHVLDVLCG